MFSKIKQNINKSLPYPGYSHLEYYNEINQISCNDPGYSHLASICNFTLLIFEPGYSHLTERLYYCMTFLNVNISLLSQIIPL